MTYVPTQLYIKETAKGNEETQKDLSIPDPKEGALGAILEDKERLNKETKDEDEKD